MDTIYGESPEIRADDSYGGNGGISVFSVRNGEDEGTITGGSGDSGSYPTSSRIYWTITRVVDPSQPGGYRYSGGITDTSWFTEISQSPFADPRYDDPSEIWNIASRDGNLNEVFDEWNSDKTEDGEEKRAYFMYHLAVNAKGCSTTLPG